MKDKTTILDIKSSTISNSYKVLVEIDMNSQEFSMRIEKGDIQVVSAEEDFWSFFRHDPMMAGKIMKLVSDYHKNKYSLEFPLSL